MVSQELKHWGNEEGCEEEDTKLRARGTPGPCTWPCAPSSCSSPPATQRNSRLSLPGALLSMGFGFVEYRKPEQAQKALKQLQVKGFLEEVQVTGRWGGGSRQPSILSGSADRPRCLQFSRGLWPKSSQEPSSGSVVMWCSHSSIHRSLSRARVCSPPSSPSSPRGARGQGTGEGCPAGSPPWQLRSFVGKVQSSLVTGTALWVITEHVASTVVLVELDLPLDSRQLQGGLSWVWVG